MIRKQSIPNLLTFARLLAVPLALGCMAANAGAWPLFLIFVAASLTDFLDGYLARRWNATSPLGAMLDPVADKLIVALMLLFLAAHTDAPLLPIILILLREIYISGLREFLAMRSIPLPVSRGGKWKTAVQMLAIALLLGALGLSDTDIWNVGVILLWLSAALALISAVQYSRASFPHLKA